MPDLASLPWPIVTLDFEASSLARDSYPIEIGIAVWDGPGTPIHTWSRLIRPPNTWEARPSWNPFSQRLHGISPEQLEMGDDPEEIVELLNARSQPGTTAYCDSSKHDELWMETLLDETSLTSNVRLASWADLIRPLGFLCRERLQHWNKTHKSAHRAGPDAVDHLRGLAFALECPEPAVLLWPDDV